MGGEQKRRRLLEEQPSEGVRALRSLPFIRERSQAILEIARTKPEGLQHFSVNEVQIPAVAAFVKNLMDDYPSYEAVPFHSRFRHFEAGGVNRVAALREQWACDEVEVARRLVDLVVPSVLLDAGAGAEWKFTEKGTDFVGGRSEGLGVASFHMFSAGAFSSSVCEPHRTDAAALQSLSDEAVAHAFQVSMDNPLVGCEGRTKVLQRLGLAISQHPSVFEKDGVFRPGHLVDYLISCADASGTVSVQSLWEVLMYGLESMWPAGRTLLDGTNMGDVWTHTSLPKDNTSWGQMIPFHKLSQWLGYSLLEPLQEAGLIRFSEVSLMTGLPEYRNGGLLIDMQVLIPKHEGVTGMPHAPDSEVIVEWRALTVSLLDEIYTCLLQLIGKTPAEFPMVKMLEGGTWKAGRICARQRDPANSSPPISIISDGTVF